MAGNATPPLPAALTELLPQRPGPVLLLMTNHHLGNFVVSLPFIDALARHFQIDVDVVVDSRHASLTSLLPSVRSVIPYMQKHRRGNGFKQAVDFLKLIGRLMGCHYRLVIDVGGGIQAVTLTTLTFAPRRIGLAASRRSWLYSERLLSDSGPHAADRFMPFMSRIGVNRRPLLRLRPSPGTVARLDSLLDPAITRDKRRIAVIHPGAGYDFRRWPPERFAAAADELVKRWGLHVIYIGAPGEEPFLQSIVAQMKQPHCAGHLVADLDIVLALFDRAAILLSNESGPTHLATLTSVPIVTIFGPSLEARWRPMREENVTILRGMVCPPECSWGKCRNDLRCVMDVGVKRVVESAALYLDR